MATNTQTIPVQVQDGVRSIRIPDEFDLSGDTVSISQDCLGRLILQPMKDPNEGLLELLRSWKPLSDDEAMPEIPKLTVEPFDF